MPLTPSNPEGDLNERVTRLERKLTQAYLAIQELKQGIGTPYADYPPLSFQGDGSSGVGEGAPDGQDAGFSRGNHRHPNEASELKLTGEGTSSTSGGRDILEVKPKTTVEESGWLKPICVEGDEIDIVGDDAHIDGVYVNLKDVPQTYNPALDGVHVEMPTSYNDDAEETSAGHFEGDGVTVEVGAVGKRGIKITGNGLIDTVHDLSDMATGMTARGIAMQGDATDASGGDGYGLDIELLGTGLDSAYAMRAIGEELGVFLQNTGTPASIGKAWRTALDVWTDATTAFDTAGTDLILFENQLDYIYIGSAAVFSAVQFTFDTPASHTIQPDFEFWNGTAWTDFTPIDGTNGLINNGIISFDSDNLTGWATTTVNGEGDGPWYYIRIQRTRIALVTDPIESTIKISDTTDYWFNKDAQLMANNIKLPDAKFIVEANANADSYFFVTDVTGKQYKVLTIDNGVP